MELSDLGLGRVARVLLRHGIQDSDDLVALNVRELGALPGIGSRSVEIILETLEHQNLTLADDPWGPYSCARHGSTGWDVSLSDLFLCDTCSESFMTRAFDGQAPEWVSEPTGGYCLNCNEVKPDVRLRQWFLCGTCERVARSIGRSIVASRFVMHTWEEISRITGVALQLHETDIPVLLRRSRENIDAKVSRPDFVAFDGDRPVFAIEMKTGRGHVRDTNVGAKIATFQLDKSDCDDILTVAKRDDLPVYLMHVQVIDRAAAPTLRYEPLALWWTDIFTMSEHFIETKTRPRETRVAAYYSTSMFRDALDLGHHVLDHGPEMIRERILNEGIPQIYRDA